MSPAVRAALPAEVDVLVVGSGAAGLTAALTAADAGLQTVVVEKSDQIGGTTAWSGGGIWAPGNAVTRRTEPERAADVDAARRYLNALAPPGLRQDLVDAYVDGAAQMVDFLHARSEVRFSAHAGEPDYHQELDGAAQEGRLLDPVEYDGRLLGDDLALLRAPLQEFNAPAGFMIGFADLPHLLGARSSARSAWHVAKMVARYGRDRLRHPRGTRLTMGNALVARLLASARRAQLPIHLEVELVGLEASDGRVTSAVLRAGGAEHRVAVRRGVVLATGGFSGDAALRKEHLPFPDRYVSLMPDSNTGDGIRAAQSVGGALDAGNYANAAYAVMSVVHKADDSVGKFPHVYLDRPKPGFLAVDRTGRRFVNEASAEMVNVMIDESAVPAYLVCDHRAVKKYGLGLVLPGGLRLKKLLAAGYLRSAESPEALAAAIGVPPAALRETVERFNALADAGRDADFGKGDTVNDRDLGDPSNQPNPCLGALRTPPYYAVEILPGGASTSLGLRVDAHARVLRGSTDVPVQGLYACGQDMNAVSRGREPSHGANIGQAMTFGYLAGRYLAQEQRAMNAGFVEGSR